MVNRKTFEDFNFQERKLDLIQRLYVDTADQDYITARWAYDCGLFTNFLWSSAQAIEKYAKSLLLLRDESIKIFNHDLVGLIEKTDQIYGSQFSNTRISFPETTALASQNWQGKSMINYLSELSVYGSADNRYAYEGLNITSGLLHALDQLVFAMRSCLQSSGALNFNILVFNNEQSNTERIKENQVEPWMLGPDLLLERIFLKKFGIGLNANTESVFLKFNHSFSPDRAKLDQTFGGLVFHGSPLYNHLVRSKSFAESEEAKKSIKDLRKWASDKLKLSPTQKKNLQY